jgi:hypothetical protein
MRSATFLNLVILGTGLRKHARHIAEAYICLRTRGVDSGRALHEKFPIGANFIMAILPICRPTDQGAK